MCLESRRLDEQIKSLKSQLKKFPKGKFFCTRNGNRYKWYHSINGKSTYIPKKKRQFAERLATKKYLTQIYEDLLHEKDAIDLYLRHHKESKADEMLTSVSEYQKLLAPYFKPLAEELCDWANSPYEKNMKYPENLKHKTVSGNLVRSKSEAMIDMMLVKNRISFRYECPLQIGDTIVYPDFTIRHPQTGKVYYWEHFGKMDVEKYARGVGGKMQLYISGGIIPGVNLITTFETKEKPLSLETIENVIKEYFL